jgi:cobalamin synthase
MLYRVGADAVVSVHLLFILFVLFGGLLVLRWRWLAALHLPAVTWGAMVEFLHLYCPLTPLENRLRQAAGQQGYDGGFIEHYLIPLIYPRGLTHEMQWGFGSVVLVLNVTVYVIVIRRFLRAPKAQP